MYSLADVSRVQFHRFPLPEGGRAHPDIHHDVQDPPSKHCTYFAWPGGTSAKCIPRTVPLLGHRDVHLLQIEAMPDCFGEHRILEGLQEHPAIIGAQDRGEQPHAVDRTARSPPRALTVATQRTDVHSNPARPQYRGGVRVAIMGTRGVPASYGGFETAVEEIGKRLAARGYDVTVYCRNPGQTLTEYEGMHLVNLPAVRHRMAETLSHTSLSAARAIIKDKPDVALVLNAGNAPLAQAPARQRASRLPFTLMGLESKREKWRGAGARYYRWAEKAAVKQGDEVIADAQAIADHVQATYGRTCAVIPYGAEVIDPGQ